MEPHEIPLQISAIGVRSFIPLLGQVCGRFNWVCYGWRQMINHYHLVVETLEANLSQGMWQLNGIYDQWINHTYGRVGNVFQRRYKGILVEKDCYLLEWRGMWR